MFRPRGLRRLPGSTHMWALGLLFTGVALAVLSVGCSSVEEEEKPESSSAAETPAEEVASLPQPEPTTEPEPERIAEPEPTPEPTPEPIPEPPPPEEDVYTAIGASLIVGDADEAIGKFEQAFSEDPEDPMTTVLYAGLLMSAGRIEEARATLLGVVEDHPELTEALYSLSLIEVMVGNDEAQLDLLNRMLAVDPEDPRPHASLGEVHLKNGKLNEARESFERSIELEPENTVALVGYGNVLLRQGEFRAAEHQFDLVIANNPEYPFAYADRSQARSERGDQAGAEEDLTTAIALEPDFYWHYVDRGRVRLLGLRDAKGALADFGRAIEIDPDLFYPYVYRAGILDQLGDREGAIRDYVKVLSDRPDYYYAYAPFAVLLYMDGRWSESRKYFRLAWEADGEEYGYPLMIGLAHLKEGNTREAKQYLQGAIQEMPRESLFYQVGRLLMEPGYDGYVTGLINKERSSVLKRRMVFYLGSYYLLSGETSLAHKYFLEVADDAPPGLYEARIASWELEKYR